MPRSPARPVWDRAIVAGAARAAFVKLHPRTMAGNPVMFVVEVGSVLVTAALARDVLLGRADLGFELQVTLWLWLTVLFANFAEAMAESRGKAQASTLRKARTDAIARRIRDDGGTDAVAAASLRIGDVCLVEAGGLIPADGEVVEGVAAVDESAITGESAPVIRESGGDRSAVTGGTRVLSDWLKVRVTANPGHTFLDRMIALVEGAERQKTPNEIALTILLAGLTIMFLLAVATLQPLAIYSSAPQSVFVLVSLLVCLIPTTIGGLLSAIGIAGMDRLVQRNVLAMSGRAVEAAGDVHTLLLDKTGTITFGNRQATAFLPVPGVSERDLAEAAQFSSLADETPEGRSIVVLAKEQYGIRTLAPAEKSAVFVPFTAQTRMSGVDLNGRSIRKGSAEAVERHIAGHGGSVPDSLRAIVDRVARSGGDAPRRGRSGARARRGAPEGRGQGRDSGAVRGPEIDGDSNGDDHRRQPAHGGVDRARGRRGRLPGRGDTRRQDAADPPRTGGRQAGRHDRRRHERRAGARAGRRGRGHELGNPGGQGGGEHGGPRFESHQADRDRRDRQATSDDARRADHVFGCERRGQVLRHHSSDVHGDVAAVGGAQCHGPPEPEVGGSVGPDLQRRHHRGPDPAGAARREVPGHERPRAAAEKRRGLRCGRRPHPVRRDQGDRSRPHLPGGGMNIWRHLRIGLLMTAVTTVGFGLAYPLIVTGIAQVLFPDQANGQIVMHHGRPVGSRLIGQPLHVARVLPPATVGRGSGLRCHEVGSEQPRSDEPGADRRREGEGGGGTARESHHRRSRRSGDDVGLGAGPAPVSSSCAVPGVPRGARTRGDGGGGPRVGRRPCRRTAAGVSGRAARERARAQHGA